MFNEYDVLDRFDAAAKAGFKAIEMQSPYGFKPEQIQERLDRNDLEYVLINLPVEDPDTGQRNVTINPLRKDLFKEYVSEGVTYAEAFGCVGINSGIGPAPEGVDFQEIRETLVDNLQYAAPRFAEVGTKVFIEAINTRDQPGFFVNKTDTARDVIEDAGIPNLGIQYDFYHMQIMEGDLIRTFEANLDLIGHVQIADTPGRHEPGTGEINYPFIFDFLDRVGYHGWVGAEYYPIGLTEAGLDWVRPYLGR